MEEKDMQPMQPEGSSLTGRRIKDGARTPVAGRRSSASEEPGISGRTGNSGRSRISGNRRLVRRKPQSRRRRQRNLTDRSRCRDIFVEKIQPFQGES